MIGTLKRAWDSFRGAGDAAVTVPPMDGALRPNRLLEDAPDVLTVPMPDDIVSDGQYAYVSTGRDIVYLDLGSRQTTPFNAYDAEITALALSQGGVLAVALADGRIVFENRAVPAAPIKLACVTAMIFLSEDTLAVAQGSQNRSAGEWKRDVMERGSTGAICLVDLGNGNVQRLLGGLGWPYGLALLEKGRLVISESWKHRLLAVESNGAFQPLLVDLPGYPARISPSPSGGYWLSVFAPRNQIIEFVQREPQFLRRMMEEVHPDHWAAPMLSPSASFLEPLQGGAQKHFGQLKPWAPSRSYGLVVRLDAAFRPVTAYHSRADGYHHGVTCAVETPAGVLVAAKGGNAVLLLDPAAEGASHEQFGEH